MYILLTGDKIQRTANKNTIYSKDLIHYVAVEYFHCSTGNQKGNPYFMDRRHCFQNTMLFASLMTQKSIHIFFIKDWAATIFTTDRTMETLNFWSVNRFCSFAAIAEKGLP